MWKCQPCCKWMLRCISNETFWIGQREDGTPLLLLPIGNDNLYDPATESFTERAAHAQLHFCPFCAAPIEPPQFDPQVAGTPN